MKTSYLFIGILLCCMGGVFTPSRSVKTGMLVLCGALSVYGILRFLG
ncbi:MAG: hypothetical protein QE265_07275 [Rhodoferax sp.]|nr:hypothetical protein [Rhodoferax sp.]